VSIEATETVFSSGLRTPLLDWPYRELQGAGRTYDVSDDGQRFLAIEEGGAEGTTARIIVVQNWFEELRRLAPPVE
jgi:hypothetical protein